MDTILLYLIVGVFAGIMAGMFGVGGGLIIVPALSLSFLAAGMSPTNYVHIAIGTSLATIVVTSISSIYAHHRRGAVMWEIFRQLAPGIIGGGLLGAVIADFMPTKALRIAFGVFEVGVAIQIGLNVTSAPHRTLPKQPMATVVGGIIGTASSVVGIGGGTLTVPFLVWCNVALRQAVATSSACGLPISLAGATGFVITGWNDPNLPSHSFGYLYWPAFLGIAFSSVLFAPLGAKLAHTLPVGILRRVFAIFLAVLGIRMLIG